MLSLLSFFRGPLVPAGAVPADANAFDLSKAVSGTASGAVTVPPLHPPKIAAAIVTIPLPAPLDDLTVGGGGRYLILSLKSLRKLAVFDMNEARIVHFIPVDSDDYHFASGARLVILYREDHHVIERWSLDTFQRELTMAAPNWPALRDMKMGSASGGPVVIELQDGSIKWLNGITLTPYQPNLAGSPWGWGGSAELSFSYRLSPDGTVMTGWLEGIEPRVIVAARFQADHTDFTTGNDDGYPGRYFTVGADDNLIYSSIGLRTLDLKAVGPAELGGCRCLPVQGGAFFLGLQGSTFALYTVQDKRLLLTLPKLDELQDGFWDLEKQIFLVPGADLLVTIPASRDRLVVHRFNLEEQVAKSGVDYLYVPSVAPATFRPGQHYGYQLVVKSKRGSVQSTLESGPQGMVLEKSGRLDWSVPANYEGTAEYIIIHIQDASGQQIYQTFRITPAVR